MLRITTNSNGHGLVLRLEGRLEGPWVAVLQQSFDGALTKRRGRKLCVDLNGVTFVDAQGKAKLAEMHAQGAELLGDDIETKALVAEIKAGRPGGGDGESRTMSRHEKANETEPFAELRRLHAELHKVNEELVEAARPLEQLGEMNLEQRQLLGDQIRAKLARWESVTQEIRRVMGTVSTKGQNEGEAR